METRTELFWKNLSFSFTKQLLLKSDFAAEHAAELHRAEAHEWDLGASRRHPVSPRVTRCVASVWHGHRSPGTAAAGERAWRAGPPGAFGAKVSTGLERAGRGRWGLRLAPATLSGRCGGRDELPRVQRLAAPASPGNPRCHGVRGSGRGPFFKLLLPLSRRGQLREQEEGAGCSQCPLRRPGPHTALRSGSHPHPWARRQTVGRRRPSSAPAARGRQRLRPRWPGGPTRPPPHITRPGQGSDPAPAKKSPVSDPPVPGLRLGGRALLPGSQLSPAGPGAQGLRGAWRPNTCHWRGTGEGTNATFTGRKRAPVRLALTTRTEPKPVPRPAGTDPDARAPARSHVCPRQKP